MIIVLDTPFDPAAVFAAFQARNKAAGAVVTFSGAVRETGDGEAVSALTLEHFPGVTERSIAEIEADARARWALADVEIIHRVGRMDPGEPIVLVCVAAAHRREAFEAADFLMDFLKTRAMFWKKETRAGADHWIEPRAEDYDDAARWKEND